MANNNKQAEHGTDKPRNAICWALRYSNAMESDAVLSDQWKEKKKIDARICVECAFTVSEKSLAQLRL